MSDIDEEIDDDDDDFLPKGDDELIAWFDNFLTHAKVGMCGITEEDLRQMKQNRDDVYESIMAARKAEAFAKEAWDKLLELDWGKPRH
jgi:hypothetical protein